MELILKQDVEGLGFKDDVVTVKNGYGRQFAAVSAGGLNQNGHPGHGGFGGFRRLGDVTKKLIFKEQ